MSLYKQGAGGESVVVVRREERTTASAGTVDGAGNFVPPVIINTNPDSTFWTVIKWLGAGLTLYVGYEKLRELYDRNLPGDGAQLETESED